MVQVLPAAESSQSAGAQFLKGLGSGLGQSLSKLPEHFMQQKQLKEENEAAKRLGLDLSGIRNPKARQQLFGLAIQGKTEEQMKKKEADLLPKMRTFADKLQESNPNSPMHKFVADVYRSDLPMDEKSNLVKNLVGVDPFKMEQQNRLQRDSLLKYYGQQIKEIDNDIKTARTDDKPALRDKKRQLQAQRDQLIDFKALQGDEDEEEESQEDLEEEKKKKPKVKFNPKNKEHIAKFKQLDKKFKGDRQKVNAALAKEFSL
jgi:hypothetical protein